MFEFEYGDDTALVNYDAATATIRVTSIEAGSLMRLIHCSGVMVTMVAPKFSLRHSRRRDLNAASTNIDAAARPLPAS